MVAKIVTGKSIRGILMYNENKVEAGDARLIMASGFAGEIDEMDFRQKLNRFRHLTALNSRTKTNALHITLNFHSSEKLSDEKLQQISAAYMEQIGFGDQPFLVYHHQDSAHPHVHLVTTNIAKDGMRIETHDIGRKLSEPARKDLEIKFDLVKAEGQQDQVRDRLEKLVYGSSPTRRAISNLVTRVSQEYSYGSFLEFKTILEEFGVLADRGPLDSQMFQKNGLQYFALDQAGMPRGVPIKASSIYRKPTMMNLEKRYAKNMEKKAAASDEVRSILKSVLADNRLRTAGDFTALLKDRGIVPLFRRNDQGLLYGITYIDHRRKVIFNGSELGKAYSAKAVSESFARAPVLKPVGEGRSGPKYPVQIGGNGELKIQPIDLPLLDILTSPDRDAAPVSPRRKKKRRKGKDREIEINL